MTIDWRTPDEYFRRIQKQGMGLSLGTFVGATQVREYVVGFDNRPPTAAELEQMKKLVADAMKEGALGVSTSLQYVPARFAKTDEIVELAKVAHQYGGIYATHQRSEANALDESTNIRKESVMSSSTDRSVLTMANARHLSPVVCCGGRDIVAKISGWLIRLRPQSS